MVTTVKGNEGHRFIYINNKIHCSCGWRSKVHRDQPLRDGSRVTDNAMRDWDGHVREVEERERKGG
jgi:hypothetical protein